MEAIMKIDTSLHTDHQLDQLAGQFEHWRQTRSHRGERIPQPSVGSSRGLGPGPAPHPGGPAFKAVVKRPETADGGPARTECPPPLRARRPGLSKCRSPPPLPRCRP